MFELFSPRQITDLHGMTSIFQSRWIPDLYYLYDLYDLYDLAHVAGLEPYNLHGLGHASWVGSVLYRSCTTFHNGRIGSRWSVTYLINVIYVNYPTCGTVYNATSSTTRVQHYPVSTEPRVQC